MARAPRVFSGFFPNIASLTLDDVILPLYNRGGAHLERLIAAAPRLAELKLNHVRAIHFDWLRSVAVHAWALRAPTLRVLKIDMPIHNGYRIPEDLRLLEEADIRIDPTLCTQDFLDTFRRIRTVNKLSFVTDSTKSKRNPLEGITWKFENLREAHLSPNSAIRSSILSIVSLLRFAPYIEDLSIEAENSGWPEDEIDEDFLNSQISDNLFASLKHVSVSGTAYSSNQICFLKFLLSKTESLQSFVLTFCYYGSNK